MPMNRLANDAVAMLLPYICVLLWPISFLHRLTRAEVRRKRVLLVSRNSVAADHMVCISDLLGSSGGVEQAVTTDRVPAGDFSRHQASRMVGPRSIHVLRALVCDWDLVVFTNHPYGFGVCFPPWIKKLYINHGFHAGKINNNQEQDGVYGRCKVIRPFRNPYYDCMFAASSREKDLAISLTPELKHRISVVGFLRADMFLEYVRDQGAGARKRLGYTPDQQVIHIISTWGENSLWNTRGEWILEQVQRLRGQYEFVVSIHPRFDNLGAGNKGSRQEILRRFGQAGVSINHNLDWKDSVIASDVTLSDHSSLCLYHVLLQHKVLLVEVDEGQYVKGSTFEELSKAFSSLSDFASLEMALLHIFDSDTSSQIAGIRAQMLDYEGAAADRYRKELELLLNEPGLLSSELGENNL